MSLGVPHPDPCLVRDLSLGRLELDPCLLLDVSVPSTSGVAAVIGAFDTVVVSSEE